MNSLAVYLKTEDEIETKSCIYCKEEKSLSEYHKHPTNKDGLDSRCKSCQHRSSRESRKIKKTAPPKPDGCECCGVDPMTRQYKTFWVLDHDHETKIFRGWLCDECNRIGKLGDTLEGVMRAVKYLQSRD